MNLEAQHELKLVISATCSFKPAFPPYWFNISVSRVTILSHLKTYNLYYEGQNLQLRHREVGIYSYLFYPYTEASVCLSIRLPVARFAFSLTRLQSNMPYPLYDVSQRSNNCPLCAFICVCALITAHLSQQEEGELIVEGLLNIFWGLRRPIRLQMQDDHERIRPPPSSTSWHSGCNLDSQG